MQITDLLELQYTPRQIKSKRAELRNQLIAESPRITGGALERIANADLALLFQFYDAEFFKNSFEQCFTGKLTFSLSTRMTRAAGKTQYSRNVAVLPAEQQEYEIKIGIPFFFNYNQLHREKTVNGIKTKDALDALQLVFEHEIVHLVELLCFNKSSCSKERFKTLARHYFGHTESYHQLPTYAEIAAGRYGFTAGSWVCFSYEGEKYKGVISRINKRATVMVPERSGAYQDRQGQCYSKWYVPLAELEKV